MEEVVEMTIHCPNCWGPHKPLSEGADGTYTETCVMCFQAFSYTVEDGVSKPWKAPKVKQAYRGTGKAGGR